MREGHPRDELPRVMAAARCEAELWLASSPKMWGPVVEDRRRLWSDRVVELIAARVGVDASEVADKLPGVNSQHRYVLLGTLARTRRCTVFAAVDQLLAREVALKVHHEIDDDLTWRLVAEMQAMARFDHANVVRVYDVGDHHGWPYSVMELCDGDLEGWCRGKAWTEVLDRIGEAGRGLAAVHAAGLVHGDVKPENVFLKGQVAKLGDFGLVTTPGWSGPVGGTPGYIAPEVADGEPGTAGDVFAFACTVWSCLVGRPPFGEPPAGAGSSAAAMVLVERAREGAFCGLGAAGDRVPSAIIAALRRALRAEPERRPTLEELLGQLGAVRSAGGPGSVDLVSAPGSAKDDQGNLDAWELVVKMNPTPSEAAAEVMKEEIEWAQCVLAPCPVDLGCQSWVVHRRLLRLLLAVLTAADSGDKWMPLIEVSGGFPAWMRIGTDTLMFERRDDDVWGYRISTSFAFGPFVAKSEVKLSEWVGQVGRDFIDTHIGGGRDIWMGDSEFGGPGQLLTTQTP